MCGIYFERLKTVGKYTRPVACTHKENIMSSSIFLDYIRFRWSNFIITSFENYAFVLPNNLILELF